MRYVNVIRSTTFFTSRQNFLQHLSWQDIINSNINSLLISFYCLSLTSLCKIVLKYFVKNLLI